MYLHKKNLPEAKYGTDNLSSDNPILAICNLPLNKWYENSYFSIKIKIFEAV